MQKIKAGSGTLCYTGTSLFSLKPYQHFFSDKYHTGMWWGQSSIKAKVGHGWLWLLQNSVIWKLSLNTLGSSQHSPDFVDKTEDRSPGTGKRHRWKKERDGENFMGGKGKTGNRKG